MRGTDRQWTDYIERYLVSGQIVQCEVLTDRGEKLQCKVLTDNGVMYTVR